MLNKYRHRVKKKLKKTKTNYTQVGYNDVFKGHHFVHPSGKGWWQFLEENNIPFIKKHFPFLSSQPLPRIKKIFDFEEYLKIGSRGEALSYLYNGLGRSLNYVGPVLDLELKHGFNDHTDRHTLWVSQTGVELLQSAGISYDGNGYFDEKTEVLMTLAGMTHDIGNFFSRKEHSSYSAWLLTRLFSHTEKNKAEFDTVLNSILFHEEPVLIDLKLAVEQGTPLQWALVAADKMHVGRDRIGGRSFQSGIKNGALEDDIHIVLNALIVRSAWYLGIRKFVWHLDFNINQLEKKFASFTTGNKRLCLPSVFQQVFKTKGVFYRDSFVKIFNHHYLNRMKLAAKCIFLLFPYVQEFVVELSDNDTHGKVGSGKMRVFRVNRHQLLK